MPTITCSNCTHDFDAVRGFETVCRECYNTLLVECACGMNYCKDKTWKQSCHVCYTARRKERDAISVACSCGRLYVKDQPWKTKCVGCWMKNKPN